MTVTIKQAGVSSFAEARNPFARHPGFAFAALVAVNAMWAFQFAGARAAAFELGPVQVTLIPLVLATVLIMPFAKLRLQSFFVQERRAWLKDIFLLGTIGVVPAQLGLVLGVHRTLASNASVISLTVPILTAICGCLILGERMTVLRYSSFAIAILGVCLLSSADLRNVRFLRSDLAVGNSLIFISCLGSAFYNSYSRRALSTSSPTQVLVASFVVADLELLVLDITTESMKWGQLIHLEASVWLCLGLIALFSLALSMLLYFTVIQAVEVVRASLTNYLLPLFGLIFSSAMLRERITPLHIAGGSLIFASSILATFYDDSHIRAEAGEHGTVAN